MLVLLWTLRTCFGTEEQRLLQQLQQQQHPGRRKNKKCFRVEDEKLNDAVLKEEAYDTPSIPFS